MGLKQRVDLVKLKDFFSQKVVNRYFVFWAHWTIRRWRPRTIVITGSSGKTGLFNLTKEILGQRAYCSDQANSNVGLVCNIIGLRPITGSRWRWVWLALVVPFKCFFTKRTEEFYLVEFDVNEPLIANIVAELKPEVCLLTNVTISHAYYFDSLANRQKKSPAELIANHFANLANLATELILVPRKQPELKRFFGPTPAEIVAVSDDYQSYKVTPEGCQFKIDGQIFSFKNPQPPALAQQLNQLIALAKHLKIELLSDWSKVPVAPSRSSSFSGPNGSFIIDSSYNSNPISVRAVFEMVSKMKVKKKWLVLGDYIELGSQTKAAHQKLVELLQQADFKEIIFFGKRLREFTWPLVQKQPKLKEKVKILNNHQEIIDLLKKDLQTGDVVLFKGAGFLENIIEQILTNPADDQLLCRRDKIFAKKRAKFLKQLN